MNDSSKRLPALDGLRALAITLVVWHHCAHYMDRSTPWLERLAAYFGTGWNGVYLFFVLSGFLVGGLAFKELQRTGSLQIARFWARRFFRTWPLYFFVLGLTLWRHPNLESVSIWPYLTFTQNWFEPRFFVHSWSLGVEEQFYLVFPVLFYLLAKINLKWLTWGAGLFTFSVAYWYRGEYLNGFFFTLHTLSVVDSLLVGVAIAYLYRFKSSLLTKVASHPTLLFLLALFFIYGNHFVTGSKFFYTNFNFGGQALGFGCLLVASLSPRFFLRPLLESRAAKWIALTSYSIYLTHDHAVYHCAKLADSLGLVAWERLAFMLPVVLAGSFALGCVFYFLIEKPALYWRDRIVPRSRELQKPLTNLKTAAYSTSR